MSTYRPSRPRRRLLSILLFATLLVSLAMPALAARLSSPKSQELSLIHISEPTRPY